MKPKSPFNDVLDLRNYTSKKVKRAAEAEIGTIDSWMKGYIDTAIQGIQLEALSKVVILHLDQVCHFVPKKCYREQINACVPHVVVDWEPEECVRPPSMVPPAEQTQRTR